MTEVAPGPADALQLGDLEEAEGASSELRSCRLRRAEQAVRTLLETFGIDLEARGLGDTPARVARMYEELLTPATFNPTTFSNDAGYDELVVACDIPFTTLCANHMLPFGGVAHVGYLPGERVIGLSKLARVVDHLARDLQVQERLTKQIADWVQESLAPRAVGVVLVSQHPCIGSPGAGSTGTKTVTSALYGLLRERPAARKEFFSLVGMPV